MANPTKELETLDAELATLSEREEIDARLFAAIGAQGGADEALARARTELDAAESALRFHERCVREVPDLIATVRFSPQRMLLLAGGDLGTEGEERLIGFSETIADLRHFLDTADAKAAVLRQRIATARKPIGGLDAAAKDAGREVIRLRGILDELVTTAERKLERQLLKS
jgi:hypothetical protein